MVEAPSYDLFVGIDVSEATFTTSWTTTRTAPRHRPLTLSQSTDGYTALLGQLQTTTVAPAATLVVLEATGNYWVALAVTLHHAGYAVAVCNPSQVHNFAKSLPRRDKTDHLDAQLLTIFAVERQPAPWSPPPALYHELRQRLVTRDSLIAMRTQARNQRHALLQWPVVITSVQTQLDGLIGDLDTRIRTLDREIATVLADGAWATSAAVLTSITGMGPITTARLLVTTLNFTLCPTPEAAAAYAGVVPRAYESGSSVRARKRLTGGGNQRVRSALYLATMSAARFNPVIRAFYERLRAAGKPMKVARIAAARKLLHIAWALVTKQVFFDPHYQPGQQAGAMADVGSRAAQPSPSDRRPVTPTRAPGDHARDRGNERCPTPSGERSAA